MILAETVEFPEICSGCEGFYFLLSSCLSGVFCWWKACQHTLCFVREQLHVNVPYICTLLGSLFACIWWLEHYFHAGSSGFLSWLHSMALLGCRTVITGSWGRTKLVCDSPMKTLTVTSDSVVFQLAFNLSLKAATLSYSHWRIFFSNPWQSSFNRVRKGIRKENKLAHPQINTISFQ